jgi:hypothetical protein
MISAGEFLKWLEVFHVAHGGVPPTDVSLQVAYDSSGNPAIINMDLGSVSWVGNPSYFTDSAGTYTEISGNFLTFFNNADVGVLNRSFSINATGTTPNTDHLFFGQWAGGFSYESVAGSESGFFLYEILDKGHVNTIFSMIGSDATNPTRIVIGGTSSTNSHVENVGINVGQSGTFYQASVLQVASSPIRNQGSMPFPLLSGTAIDGLTVSDNPIGLFAYNTTNDALNYYDSTGSFKSILTQDKVIQGTNMAIDYNSDGSITLNSAGSSGATDIGKGQYTVAANTVSFPTDTSFTPIKIDATKFAVVEAVGVNVYLNPINTPALQSLASTAQIYAFDFTVTVRGTSLTPQIFNFNPTIHLAGGSYVNTNYFTSTVTTDNFTPVVASLTGIVTLNPNDALILTVNNVSSGDNLVINTLSGRLFNIDTYAGLNSTDNLVQGSTNWYLSTTGGSSFENVTGGVVSGHVAIFSGTTGLIADGGMLITGTLPATLNFPTASTYTFPNGNSTLVPNTGANATGTWPISITGAAGSATDATSVATNNSTSSSSFYPLFVASSSGGFQSPLFSSAFSFVPSTNVLTCNISGSATTAGLATDATSWSITNVTNTANYFIPFVNASATGFRSGNCSSNLFFNPGAGVLVAPDINVSNLNTNILVATDGSSNLIPADTISPYAINISGSSASTTVAINANNINTISSSTPASFYPLFVASTTNGYQQATLNSGFSYNPSTNVLSLATVNASSIATVNLVATDGGHNLVAASGTYGISISGTAAQASLLNVTNTTTNASYYISFVPSPSTGFQAQDISSNLMYNPSTNILSTTGLNLSGLTASYAVVTDGSKNLATVPNYSFIAAVTVTGSSQAMSLGTRYFNNYSGGQCAYTLLPATGSGKQIDLQSLNTSSPSGWIITANGTDKIQYASSLSAAGGTLTSTTGSSTDCATLTDSASGLWVVYPALGLNLVVT